MRERRCSTHTRRNRSLVHKRCAVVWDRDKRLANRLMPASMPTTIVLDKKGAVKVTHTGYHEGDDVLVDREVRRLF